MSVSSSPSYGVSNGSLESLVQAYMAIQERPLKDLKAQRDELNVQYAVFSDLSNQISALKTAASDLSTTTASVFGNKKVATDDDKRVTATAYSSASNGTYVIDGIQLATAQRLKSTAGTGWTAPTDGSFTVNGQTITVTAGQTLADIRSAINKATYDSGKGVSATVVNGTLVLDAASTGSGNEIALADVSGSLLSSIGFVQTRAASNATFNVNGIAVSRAKNTGLDDVVSGLVIDLKGNTTDSVTLTVGPDSAAIRGKIDTFLSKLNSLTDYLKNKTAITKGDDGNYTRGALNGYSLYTDLKSSLSMDMSKPVGGTTAGNPTCLADLGITLDSSLHFVVSDSSKLDNLIASNPGGVAAVFQGDDGVATRVLNRVTPYVTSSNAYVTREQNSITSMQKSLDARIQTMNERLDAQEAAYRSQLSKLQEALNRAVATQNQLSSLFAYYSTSSS